jgi:hypothetical protein
MMVRFRPRLAAFRVQRSAYEGRQPAGAESRPSDADASAPLAAECYRHRSYSVVAAECYRRKLLDPLVWRMRHESAKIRFIHTIGTAPAILESCGPRTA